MQEIREFDLQWEGKSWLELSMRVLTYIRPIGSSLPHKWPLRYNVKVERIDLQKLWHALKHWHPLGHWHRARVSMADDN